MSLPSFNRYKKYRNSIENRTADLEMELENVQEALEKAKISYTNQFEQGGDVEAARLEVFNLKNKIDQINHEIEVVSTTDFRKKDILADLLHEFRAKQREVNEAINKVHNEAEILKEELRAKITNLNNQLITIDENFRTGPAAQMLQCYHELEISQNLKDSIRLEAATPQFHRPIDQV